VVNRTLRRLKSEEGGYIVVFAAIALTVLLGAAAWTFDGGRWHRDSLRLQATADSAALAGARQLPAANTADPKYAAAIAAATDAGNTNLNQVNNGDGGTNGQVSVAVTQSTVGGKYDTVRVTASDTQSGTLSKAIGVNSSNRFRSATARVQALSSLGSGAATPIVLNACYADPAHAPTYCAAQQQSLWGQQHVVITVTADGVAGNFQAVNLCQSPPCVINAGDNLFSDTGAKAVKNALDALTPLVSAAAPGHITILFPVYDSTGLQGANAYFHILGFAAFQIDTDQEAKAAYPASTPQAKSIEIGKSDQNTCGNNGNCGSIEGQFVYWTTSSGDGSGGQVDFGLTALNLIQ